MAFDLNSLTAYVDELKLPLIKKSILQGRTVELVNVQPDIKSSATINKIGSTMIGQNGGCGWSPTGTTSITQRTISVCPIKFEEALCLDDLEQYYLQKSMRPGSYNEEIPFEGIFAEEKAEQLQAIFEDILWKGDTDTGVGNLALCDGWFKLFDEVISGDTVNGNTGSYTAITAANIIDIVDDMVAVIATDVINVADLHLFVGYDFYRTYSKALRDANLFHYTGAENQGQDFSQMIPGSNIRIIAVRGINGTNRAVLTPASNLYVGTDLLNDYENFQIFYSADQDEVRFRSKFKLGVEVAFPEFVVDFKLV
jgi:hypothetical protein